MKKFILIILLFTCFSQVFAQKNSPETILFSDSTGLEATKEYINADYTFLFGAAFMVSAPRGEYKKEVQDLGFGFSINLAGAIPSTPLFVLLEGNLVHLGSMEWSDAMKSDVYNDTYFEVNSNFNFFNLNTGLRLVSENEYFQPYLELLGGFNYFYTSTSIEFDEFDCDECDETDVEFDDIVWSGGVGAGLTIPLVSTGAAKPKGLFLDLGMRYIFSGKAEYIKEGDLHIRNGEQTYDITRSRTDMFQFKLGITLMF